jgi:hypothetical protein
MMLSGRSSGLLRKLSVVLAVTANRFGIGLLLYLVFRFLVFTRCIVLPKKLAKVASFAVPVFGSNKDR